MTYGLMLGSCIFCTVLTLAVYALLRAAAEADRGARKRISGCSIRKGGADGKEATSRHIPLAVQQGETDAGSTRRSA